MAELGPEIANSVLAACRSGAAEAAAALGRALGGEFTLSPEMAPRYDPNALPPAWTNPGLMFVAASAGGGVAILLPAEGDLLPDWSRQWNEESRRRLLVLARELAVNLFPNGLSLDRLGVRWVENFAAAAASCGVTAGASMVSLALARGAQQGTLWLLWPLANVDGFTAPASETRIRQENASKSNATSPLLPPPKRAPQERILYETIEEVLPFLPVYSRSLLKIKTPVRVTLASTRLPVKKIVELAPGSLIQFPKSCEETLELEVGEQVIARGEAVKVGEKFGLRVTSMVLPGERFAPIAPRPKKK